MTAGVLLHYHGGSVYALPVRHVSGLVWDLAVAGSVLRCVLRNANGPMDGAWLRTPMTLAELASAPAIQRHVEVMTAERAAASAAEHERVALEMERTPTKAQAKRTGKGRAKR